MTVGALLISLRDGDYDSTIYINEDKCLEEIKKLKDRHPYDMDFRIKTVEII